MTALPQRKTYPPEEYLALEREAEEKSEFHDGVIVRRASSDIDHVSIMVNLASEIHTQIKQKRQARVLMCDMKIRTPDARYFFYPDILVLLDKPIFNDRETDVVLNPGIIVEIISKETAAFDRNDKFLIYQKFESLKEYILVDQRIPRVEKFVRSDTRVWNYKAVSGLEKSIKFQTIESEIRLFETYRSVETTENYKEVNL